MYQAYKKDKDLAGASLNHTYNHETQKETSSHKRWTRLQQSGGQGK